MVRNHPPPTHPIDSTIRYAETITRSSKDPICVSLSTAYQQLVCMIE